MNLFILYFLSVVVSLVLVLGTCLIIDRKLTYGDVFGLGTLCLVPIINLGLLLLVFIEAWRYLERQHGDKVMFSLKDRKKE